MIVDISDNKVMFYEQRTGREVSVLVEYMYRYNVM